MSWKMSFGLDVDVLWIQINLISVNWIISHSTVLIIPLRCRKVFSTIDIMIEKDNNLWLNVSYESTSDEVLYSLRCMFTVTTNGGSSCVLSYIGCTYNTWHFFPSNMHVWKDHFIVGRPESKKSYLSGAASNVLSCINIMLCVFAMDIFKCTSRAPELGKKF